MEYHIRGMLIAVKVLGVLDKASLREPVEGLAPHAPERNPPRPSEADIGRPENGVRTADNAP